MSEEDRWRRPKREALKVYITRAGGIAIKQEEAVWREAPQEDAVIVLESGQVQELIRWLQEALEELPAMGGESRD